MVVRAWQTADGAITLRADGSAEPGHLELAIERMRFALCLDDDLSDFYARFKGDRCSGR